MMGLRLREGVDLARHEALAGQPLGEGAIAELAGLELLARDGARIRATEAGRPVLDGVLKRLLSAGSSPVPT